MGKVYREHDYANQLVDAVSRPYRFEEASLPGAFDARVSNKRKGRRMTDVQHLSGALMSAGESPWMFSKKKKHLAWQ